MRYRACASTAVFLVSSVLWNHEGVAKMVAESARGIPVVHDVDVVVVGGSTGAVAVAAEAARSGATVFLAAPRPYLGEDMCASYRLWLEPGETPAEGLAARLYSHPGSRAGLPLTYEASLPSVGKHKDTEQPSRLADGRIGSAVGDSVQYDGDVTLTVDLGKVQSLASVAVHAFQSPNDYEVGQVQVALSDDGKSWRDVAEIANPAAGKSGYFEKALKLETGLSGRTRYLRLDVRRAPKTKRLLLAEIDVQPLDEARGNGDGALVTTPMQVKRILDEELLDAGVTFLYGCAATDVLVDDSGAPAGIVMVNRAGRQAVKAKVVIDATDRAWLARNAGAAFAAYPSGKQTFKRVVVGGKPCEGKGVTARTIRLRYSIGGRPPAAYGSSGFGSFVQKRNQPMSVPHPELIEYTLELPMKDGSFASFAEAEQRARDLTFSPEQVDESEVLFQVPPDPVRGKAEQKGAWQGSAAVDLDALRPRGVEHFYVLGGCADVSRAAAAELMKPNALIALGARVGKVAAAEAKARSLAGGVRLPGEKVKAAASGDTRDLLVGLRPWETDLPTIPAAARGLRVVGEYDVVVIGGGTGGAPAGVGAARQGAKTLVVEYLHGLGGVATTGLIGIYCAGYRKGFTAETEAGIGKVGATSYIVGKMEWWRREIRRSKGDIWFGAMGCGAFVENGKVKGAIVATPEGRGVVLANVVIDGTGHADVAAAAGAECMYTGGEHFGMQGAGLPYREPGASYINTDWTYIDDSDMVDRWTAFVIAKQRNRDAYDLGQLIDTRERRRIVGDYVLSPLDVINGRTFPDTVGLNQGGRLDKHGRPVHPYYQISNFLGGVAHTPYRCMLPKGLDGILVVGVGISAHCDAIPSVRMQPGVQNLGYAAGVAGAMASSKGLATRAVDVRALQKHLVARECLTPEVLEQGDSYPLPLPRIEAAVKTLVEKDYSELAVIMACTDRALPLLRKAHDEAISAEGKLRCAHVLGMLGDPAGVDTLIKKLESAKEYDTENIGHYFPNMTWLDSYVLALGYAGDRKATKTILDKLTQLKKSGNTTRSHRKCIVWALERLGDPAAAQALAEELKIGGLDKGAVTSTDEAIKERRTKNGLYELILARALYRCGDCDGMAEKVLRTFADDVRGHFARHARAILAEKR